MRLKVAAGAGTLLALLAFTLAAAAPRLSAADGSVLVRLAGGTFWMGSAPGQGDEDEHPRCQVTVASFYLATTPVTNAQYSLFLQATQPSPLQACRWIRLGGVRAAAIDMQNGQYRARAGYERHPVCAVSYLGAQTYCDWAHLRLPTEAEWEYAARGGQNDCLYPWGNASPKGHANFGRAWGGAQDPPTTAVDRFLPNPYRLYDMAGNVWQWTSSPYGYYPYHEADRNVGEQVHFLDPRVARGGSFGDDETQLRCAYRLGLSAHAVGEFCGGVGFRCARDVRP